MVCTKCGAAMPADAEFCSECGTQVIRIRSAPAIGWDPESNRAAPAAEPEYAGDDAVAPSAVVVPHKLLYAGFWLRAIAYVIDMSLVALLALPLLALLTPLAGNHWDEYSKLPMQEMFNMQNPAVRPFMLVALPAVLFCGWLYYALCESSSWQATPGKRLLGLRVCDLNGRPLSFGRASGRFLGRIVTGFVPFGIGYLMAGLTARKQALHDMIAGCLVLRQK
jgi:uncharacterized RDD family membrane protein YckC/RNA polymerase subunit RPABC4/transcription elongation factor Spt4